MKSGLPSEKCSCAEVPSDLTVCAKQLCNQFQLSDEATSQEVAGIMADEVLSAFGPDDKVQTNRLPPCLELVVKRIAERVSEIFFETPLKPSYSEVFEPLFRLLSRRQQKIALN